MKKHFMSVYNYSTKNKAHAEFQKFVSQFHYCLVTDIRLGEIVEELKKEILLIKEKYPRCDMIKLETWSHTEGTFVIAVSGNFQMDVHQVRRFESSDNDGKPHCWGKMTWILKYDEGKEPWDYICSCQHGARKCLKLTRDAAARTQN